MQNKGDRFLGKALTVVCTISITYGTICVKNREVEWKKSLI